jgi:type II restriction enzyme
MLKLKTADLVNAISKLDRNRTYSYYSGNTNLQITEVIKPEGSINFIRWKSNQSKDSASKGIVNTAQLGTVASVFSGKPNYPIHLDRLFAAGGNSRSALETLLVLTPNFFICYPQRTNPYTGELENNLRHIMWCPDDSHPLGEIGVKEYDKIVLTVELSNNFGDSRIKSKVLDLAIEE